MRTILDNQLQVLFPVNGRSGESFNFIYTYLMVFAATATMASMTDNKRYTVRRASWAQDAERLMQVRHAVFIVEQGIPESLEKDAHDPVSLHLLAEDEDGHPLGTARLLDTGQIGRMAVLPAWRNTGIGHALLAKVIEAAALRGLEQVFLHAQLSAESFYLQSGFQPDGEVFEEAGIPHRTLRMTVQ